MPDSNTVSPAAPDPARGRGHGERTWADALALWRLCEHARCRRARACRRAGHCFKHSFALLPEGVQAWFAGVAQAQEDGVSFDDAMQWLDASDAGDAFRDWHADVAASLGEDASLPVQWWRAPA